MGSPMDTRTGTTGEKEHDGRARARDGEREVRRRRRHRRRCSNNDEPVDLERVDDVRAGARGELCHHDASA